MSDLKGDFNDVWTAVTDVATSIDSNSTTQMGERGAR